MIMSESILVSFGFLDSSLFDEYLSKVILKVLIYSKTIDGDSAKIGQTYFFGIIFDGVNTNKWYDTVNFTVLI